MLLENLTRLEYLCNTIPALLNQLNENDFSSKPAPGKWSKKEVMGHLIDSATNNHHRWVRAQFEDVPVVSYDQNKWNEFSYYNEMPTHQVISFWTAYNLQIAALIRLIPQQNLQRLCGTSGQPVTLEWLFIDYVSHLEHHLKQIIDY